MSAHTLGKWQIDEGADGAWIVYVGSVVDVGKYAVIASRGNWAHRATESKANARLIAAAPDLLASASAVLAMCDAIGDFRNGVTDPNGTIDEGEVRAGELLQSLRSAIAKATGSQS